MFLQQMG
jgi:hypothetical protein